MNSTAPLPPMGGALFLAVSERRFEATDYCRGPWSLERLHGGPVVGLLAWTVEQAALASREDDQDTSESLLCSRLTVEMLRAVPLGVLDVRASMIKPGRRSVVIDGEIHHDGTLVARASSQWLRHDGTAIPAGPPLLPLPPRPEQASDPREGREFEYPTPGFNADTGELRYVCGSHEMEGPGTTWLRFASPLIDGRDNSPFVKAALVSDLAAAAGWERTPTGNNYINPDVTLQLHRRPRGDWLALDARAEHTGNGVGMMTATLFDDLGPIGRVIQSLVETPMALDADSRG